VEQQLNLNPLGYKSPQFKIAGKRYIDIAQKTKITRPINSTRLEKETAHIENKEIPKRKTQITQLEGRVKILNTS